MGLNEKLFVAADGSILYISNYFDDAELVLTEDELEDLLSKVEFFTTDVSYEPKQNAADYFVYKVTMETTSGIKIVQWVDEWASEETLPPELLALQDQILNIIESLHQNGEK